MSPGNQHRHQFLSPGSQAPTLPLHQRFLWFSFGSSNGLAANPNPRRETPPLSHAYKEIFNRSLVRDKTEDTEKGGLKRRGKRRKNGEENGCVMYLAPSKGY